MMTKDPLIGQQLGNFRIERLVGRGGMAQVYYGWDVKLQRPAAIKVIDTRYRHSPAYASRFVREARAAAAWRHENIIQVYHADEQGGLYYFAMEYIEGLDLSKLLAQYADEGELMPHPDVLRIGCAVASALDYAHQRGMIHRDVKPSNVMLAKDGRVVLTDFGLALDVQQGSIGEVFSSPHYIAPEQARHSADAVPQSDLYSLGVILYEMLSGLVPFDDPSATSVALQHVTMAPPSPRQLNPELNAETEAVLLKALSKSPEDRYPTGKALLDALEAALQAAPMASLVEQPLLPPDVEPPARRLSLISANNKISSLLQTQAAPSDPTHAFAPGASLVGQQLDEYHLEALLGHGGMARVYRGLDVRLNRYVAIKVIDTPFRADPDYLVRFEREAQAIARLEHPYIVQLYRYGEDQGLLYMAMQYIDGADLSAILQSYRDDGEFIEAENAQRLVRDICEALDYAHAQGIIHRDVKPANVMLNKQGRAILTDFGLALLTEAGTQGLIFGSPHYIAPEQAISSANVIPKSDLYSVGVIMYEMFTGQVPFDAEDPLDVAMLHMTAKPRPPREMRPDLSPEIEAVILKAIAHDPENRYSTGAELVAALKHALQTSPQQPSISRRTIPQRVAAERSVPQLPPELVKASPAQVTPSTTPAPPLPSPTAPAAGTTPQRNRLSFYAVGITVVACVLFALLASIAALALRGARQTGEKATATAPTIQPAIPDAQATPTMPVNTPTANLGTQTPPSTPLPVDTETSPAVPANTPTADLGTQVPSSTPLPVDTETSPAVPATATLPTPSPTIPSPDVYNLLIAKRAAEGVFVINQSNAPLPLAPLRLTNDKGTLEGAEWSLDSLEKDDCVNVWKDKGAPRLPAGVTCNVVGQNLTRDKEELFWDKTFNVYYDDQWVAICGKEVSECPVHISTRASYTLLIAKRENESLFVINHTTEAFPLHNLQLLNDKGQINGIDWGITQLESGRCVAVWSNREDPKPPEGITCDAPVGARLVDENKEPFWKEAVAVYYAGELTDTCEKKVQACIITIPIR